MKVELTPKERKVIVEGIADELMAILDRWTGFLNSHSTIRISIREQIQSILKKYI